MWMSIGDARQQRFQSIHCFVKRWLNKSERGHQFHDIPASLAKMLSNVLNVLFLSSIAFVAVSCAGGGAKEKGNDGRITHGTKLENVPGLVDMTFERDFVPRDCIGLFVASDVILVPIACVRYSQAGDLFRVNLFATSLEPIYTYYRNDANCHVGTFAFLLKLPKAVLEADTFPQISTEHGTGEGFTFAKDASGAIRATEVQVVADDTCERVLDSLKPIRGENELICVRGKVRPIEPVIGAPYFEDGGRLLLGLAMRYRHPLNIFARLTAEDHTEADRIMTNLGNGLNCGGTHMW